MIEAVVTDIEGTTSSLSFVKDVLFPYARERMGSFIRSHRGDPQVQAHLAAARLAAGADLDEEALIAQLGRWIDEDQKVTPLKALQGMIWQQGYRDGDFTGHVYADAVENLQQWHDQGVRLYVFSSGSVAAQKLLFGHSDGGDLTPLFSGYFDTTTGSKKDPEAYGAIVQAIGLPARHILFLSDLEAELDAAREAGMQTIWVLREGEIPAAARHHRVPSFNAIDLGQAGR